MKHTSSDISQNGSALFIVLIAVVLFAALTFAISQQRDTGQALSSEKIKLLVSEVVDMGNKMSDTVAQLRLKRVKSTAISFDNTVVTGYANPNCLTDACKVYAFEGGGRDWETAAPEINGNQDWFYTGDLAIENIGTTEADLVGILPNISEATCNEINKMLSIYGSGGTPIQFNGVVANKFTGNYPAVPVAISNPQIQGRKSACIRLSSPSGTAVAAGLPSAFYAYYQVLEAR